MEGALVSPFVMMLGVTACYTITSLSDKRAAKDGFSSKEFTFLMCASMSLFIAVTLPFQELRFDLCPQSIIGVLLIALCKLTEFSMSVLVLRQISAFELKAWLGLTLFLSYFTDVILGKELQALKILCILVTVAGLFLIVASEKAEKADYKKLILPLSLYLLSKFGYGLVIRIFTKYASSVCILLPALVLVALIMLPGVRFAAYRRNPSATGQIVLARIPNAAGMLLENAVIAISLSDYSLIQPLILVTLFIIGFFRKEYGSWRNVAGGIICIAGVIGFQLL